MKLAYYHMKGDGNHYVATYEDSETLARIKSDMRCNQCVLDAIFYRSTGKITMYSKSLVKGDIYGNLE